MDGDVDLDLDINPDVDVDLDLDADLDLDVDRNTPRYIPTESLRHSVRQSDSSSPSPFTTDSVLLFFFF